MRCLCAAIAIALPLLLGSGDCRDEAARSESEAQADAQLVLGNAVLCSSTSTGSWACVGTGFGGAALCPKERRSPCLITVPQRSPCPVYAPVPTAEQP